MSRGIWTRLVNDDFYWVHTLLPGAKRMRAPPPVRVNSDFLNTYAKAKSVFRDLLNGLYRSAENNGASVPQKLRVSYQGGTGVQNVFEIN